MAGATTGVSLGAFIFIGALLLCANVIAASSRLMMETPASDAEEKLLKNVPLKETGAVVAGTGEMRSVAGDIKAAKGLAGKVGEIYKRVHDHLARIHKLGKKFHDGYHYLHPATSGAGCVGAAC